MIVLDASAVVELLTGTGRGVQVATRIQGEVLIAPELLDVEVLSVLRRLAITGKLISTEATGCVAFLRRLTIARTPQAALLSRIWALRNNLSAYDAAYVALAESEGCPLLTCDGRLGASVGHSAIIEVVAPPALSPA